MTRNDRVHGVADPKITQTPYKTPVDRLPAFVHVLSVFFSGEDSEGKVTTQPLTSQVNYRPSPLAPDLPPLMGGGRMRFLCIT